MEDYIRVLSQQQSLSGGKSFCLDPILDTYKKKIIENPIVDKILEMIAKAHIDRLDLDSKK